MCIRDRDKNGVKSGILVDNGNNWKSPFYGDKFQGTHKPHKIPKGYPGEGGEVRITTVSMYDSPYRSDGNLKVLQGKTLEWQAVTFVFCVKNGGKDQHLVGGVTYGFRRKWNAANGKHDTAVAFGPKCISGPDAPSIGLSWGAIRFKEYESALNRDPTVDYDIGREWESQWLK